MGTEYVQWNEMKVDATNFNCKTSTETGSSWQRSVKRKFEGLKLCSENLISEEQGTGSTVKNIVAEDIQCRQIYQQPNNVLLKELSAQPIEQLTNSMNAGELGRVFMSKQQSQSRIYGCLRLPEGAEQFSSLRGNAQYSACTSVAENISPNRMYTEKKGASRNALDREAESRLRLMEFENQVCTLREALRSQHWALQNLYTELEEERNASSTAANETLSMISRLQEEKAALHMESRQFKRMAEEKLTHYQESLTTLEDLIYRKDEEIAALECEVQAYRHRLLSIGFDDLEIRKIRWPGRSYPNDSEDYMALSEDCDSGTGSHKETVEAFDGYDSLCSKTSNTIEDSQGRDLLERQEKKGKKHISKDENTCLDNNWNDGTHVVDSSQPKPQLGDMCSQRVMHGQDRTFSNCHRVQVDECSASRKSNRETARGYAIRGNNTYSSEGPDFDCKGRPVIEKYRVDLEGGVGTSFLEVRDAEHEIAMNTHERSHTDDNVTLWEQIESLEDRLEQLSKRRMHNCHLDDEWRATSKELQKTIAAYTASLREGSKSHWRLSSDKTGICDGSMGEVEVESSGEIPGLATVCEKGKPTKEPLQCEVEVSCSEKGAVATNDTDDESDGNFSVHDVYVVRNDCGRTRRSESHRGTVLNLDLEDGDRLGKPDPLSETRQEDVSFRRPDLAESKVTSSPHHETQFPRVGDGVCSADSCAPMEPCLDTSPLDGEIKQLSTRLQLLEGDREFMRQAIGSLQKEREELELLKEIAQQLRQLQAPAKSLKVVKKSPPQEDASIVAFMKGILSFNVFRSNIHKNMAVGSCNSVGLSYLLEKAPTRRMPMPVTKVTKANIVTAARTGLGQETEDVL